MIYRVRKLSSSDVNNYLNDVGVEFEVVRNSRRLVDLETNELPLSVVIGLLDKGGMVYEQIAFETWWYIRPEEGSYAQVIQKLRECRSHLD